MLRGEHYGYIRTGSHEADVLGCAHCSASIVLPPDKVRPGHCFGCDRTVCRACAAKLTTGRCAPFEKRMEETERRAALHRSMGIE